MELNGAAQIEETATQLGERLRNSTSRQQSKPFSHNCVAAEFPDVRCSLFLHRASVIHLFLKMARKVDEAANLVFVQLIEQELFIYDKRHPDCARSLVCDYVYIFKYRICLLKLYKQLLQYGPCCVIQVSS
jgi:hypothetical protein